MKKIVTAGRWFLQVIDSLESSNVNCESLCSQVSINYQQMKADDGRINIDLAFDFWQALSDQLNDSEIGLKLAKNVNVSGFKALGFSLLTSDTLLDACQRLVRYQKIMGDAGHVSLEPHDDHYSFVIELVGNKRSAPHHPIDASFASLLNIMSWILRSQVTPVWVHLKRLPPENTACYEEVFNCLPKFLQIRNEIAFSKATLQAPLLSADKSLAHLHDKITEQDLQSLSADGLSCKVREIIIRKLPQGEVKLEDILAYFSIGKRTFQRKLKEEGYTFFQLVDESRKNTAKEYVNNTQLSFEEIAFLLGFTEHANFSRAFKRWYGCTPGQYRNQGGDII